MVANLSQCDGGLAKVAAMEVARSGLNMDLFEINPYFLTTAGNLLLLW